MSDTLLPCPAAVENHTSEQVVAHPAPVGPSSTMSVTESITTIRPLQSPCLNPTVQNIEASEIIEGIDVGVKDFLTRFAGSYICPA
jgi:hypothetical protein